MMHPDSSKATPQKALPKLDGLIGQVSFKRQRSRSNDPPPVIVFCRGRLKRVPAPRFGLHFARPWAQAGDLRRDSHGQSSRQYTDQMNTRMRHANGTPDVQLDGGLLIDSR